MPKQTLTFLTDLPTPLKVAVFSAIFAASLAIVPAHANAADGPPDERTGHTTPPPSEPVEDPSVQSESLTAAESTVNGKIAFMSPRDDTSGDGYSDIFTANPDGTNAVNLTSTQNVDEETPVWSHDGKKIAYTLEPDGDWTDWHLWVMNADGSGKVALSTSGDNWYPNWSPNNTKIAFTNWVSSSGEIFIVNPDGTGLINLTNNAANDRLSVQEQHWSPDGLRLVFQSNRDGNEEIYIMNADGSGLFRLTNHADDDLAPAWSPDGTKIAFTSNRDGDYEIYVINPDGTGLVNLTNNSIDDASYFRGPVWSPDGSKIAYSELGDIVVMNADGSSSTKLTDITNNDFRQRWSPDGSQLAFERWDGSEWRVYTINVDGTGLTQLVNFYSFNPVWAVVPAVDPLPDSDNGASAVGRTVGSSNFDPSDALPEAGLPNHAYLLTIGLLYGLARLRRPVLQY